MKGWCTADIRCLMFWTQSLLRRTFTQNVRPDCFPYIDSTSSFYISISTLPQRLQYNSTLYIHYVGIHTYLYTRTFQSLDSSYQLTTMLLYNTYHRLAHAQYIVNTCMSTCTIHYLELKSVCQYISYFYLCLFFQRNSFDTVSF